MDNLNFIEETSWEFYYHEQQIGGNEGIRGHDLEKSFSTALGATVLGSLSITLRYSKMIEGWIAKPETYPEDLKEIFPCLWGNLEFLYLKGRSVPFLLWRAGRVEVGWRSLNDEFDSNYPALVAKHPGFA